MPYLSQTNDDDVWNSTDNLSALYNKQNVITNDKSNEEPVEKVNMPASSNLININKKKSLSQTFINKHSASPKEPRPQQDRTVLNSFLSQLYRVTEAKIVNLDNIKKSGSNNFPSGELSVIDITPMDKT